MAEIDWSYVLQSIVTPTGITLAVTFLARTWISERLKQSIKAEYDAKLADIGRRNSQELAQLTSALARENGRDLERIKGEAALDAERFKQRFSLLASKQAEAAIALSERLAALDTAARRLVMPGSPSTMYEELYKTCEDARFGATEYIDGKRLLFPIGIGFLADQIIKRAARCETAKHIAMISSGQPSPEIRQELRDAWADITDGGMKDLLLMTDKLRELIGGTTS